MTKTRREPTPGAGGNSAPRTLERWVLPAAFAVYLGLVAWLVLHHEPWRDEADTWLAARDLSPAGLFRFANYVGSPTLWYYLQMPLAKLGAPYASLGLLNAAFAALGVALFLWRAPFAWPVRVLFAFSYFASYEYGAIARSYALSMALIFALAARHARRLESPIRYAILLALLLNTNVHSLVVGTTVLGVFGWDALRGGARSPRLLAGLGVALAGWVLALLQIVPRPDGQLAGLSGTIDGSLIWVTLTGALIPTAESFPPAVLLAGLLYAAAAVSLLRNPLVLLVLIGSSAGLWALFVLKYAGSHRHWGFLLLAMLYALWIGRAEDTGMGETTPSARAGQPRGKRPGLEMAARLAGRAVAVGLPLALAWAVYVAAEFWIRDTRDRFSASRSMATYLSRQGLTEIPIAAWPAPHTESLLPYLPGARFYYPGIRDYGTHMKWDRACVAGWDIPEDEVVRRVDEAFPPGMEALLLANQPMAAAEAAGFRLVHAEIGDVISGDEQYFLYRRGPAQVR